MIHGNVNGASDRYPLPAIGQGGERQVWCGHYSECLHQAAMEDWPGWSCADCSDYQRRQITPAELQDDSDHCRALIEAIFNKRLSAKFLDRILDLLRGDRDFEPDYLDDDSHTRLQHGYIGL